MQWLNPKAWLAAVSGMGAFAADGDTAVVWEFAAIYFVVCWLSIFCWAWAGTALRGWLANAARVLAVEILCEARARIQRWEVPGGERAFCID